MATFRYSTASDTVLYENRPTRWKDIKYIGMEIPIDNISGVTINGYTAIEITSSSGQRFILRNVDICCQKMTAFECEPIPHGFVLTGISVRESGNTDGILLLGKGQSVMITIEITRCPRHENVYALGFLVNNEEPISSYRRATGKETLFDAAQEGELTSATLSAILLQVYGTPKIRKGMILRTRQACNCGEFIPYPPEELKCVGCGAKLVIE